MTLTRPERVAATPAVSETSPPREKPLGPILVLAGMVALVTMGLAIYGSQRLDIALKDPDGWLGPSWIRMPAIVAVCMAIDVIPRVVWRIRKDTWRGWRATLTSVRTVTSERWPLRRLLPVLAMVAFFYLSYVGYRNLKNYLPFMDLGNHDQALIALDRAMFFGADPGAILHDVLGTGASAYVLSWVYMVFLIFVPVSVVASLVWSKTLSHGMWYVTALCLNWALGTLSYYLVPADGPFNSIPQEFWDLPNTGAEGLQFGLRFNRDSVLIDAAASGKISGIAAFASLHTSIIFTAALVMQLVKVQRIFRWAMWVYFALVVLATVYFGWHYVIDDVAGVAIGYVAVAAGALATGNGHLMRLGRKKPDVITPKTTAPA